ncbi:MFS transporter [Affinibrenneria salicis]|uniref:MFS transporter n=1 Tax=Affinibrenneria salicis TaxID=2590031 RepID=A0A5J5FSW7_9GAMM|nr:MFS transporter [Affinibrenneria salicis]KAA8996620.1 MFS transporter [Affinibrenneria salicis]
MNESTHEMKPALTAGRMVLFAAAIGAMVANLYYAQPLLAEIGHSFGRQATQAGLLVTLTQLGYGIGVLLIVPLGDGMDRRRLTSIMLAVCVAALLAAAASPGFMMLAAASLAFGMTSSATMVVIPYVASHASDAERGRRTGQVMTGLLLGILLARTVSGFVSVWAGWRAIYVLAAVVVAMLGIALRGAMQPDPPRPTVRYGRLLRSLAGLLHAEPELRRRSLYALLGLGGFSAMWTGLTFLLTDPPYRYSTETVGLFGLLGAAGALSANFAGRLGDRGLAQMMTGAFSVLLLVSWSLLAIATDAMVWLIIGIFMADVAAQGLQVTHQSVLYRLAPEIRSRITAVFVTSGFVGMSLGTALASLGYAHHGWPGVCLIGAAFPAALVVHWLWSAAGTTR